MYIEKEKRIYQFTQEIANKVNNIPGVIDNTNSTSTTDALSANMGKVLSGMVNTKQTILESGTNIKTINGISLLGSGNIEIEGGGGSGGTFVVGSGLTFDSTTGEYRVSDALFAEIDGKYDKTGGTVSGNVLVTGEPYTRMSMHSYMQGSRLNRSKETRMAIIWRNGSSAFLN